MRSHLVAVVAYDDLCTFEFGCAVEIFSVRWLGIDVPWYNFGVCAATRSPLRATGGVRFIAPHSLRLLDRADTCHIFCIHFWLRLDYLTCVNEPFAHGLPCGKKV